MRKITGVFVCAALALAGAQAAQAQDYPTRPVRVVIAFPPGGPTDFVGRLVTDKMSAELGQRVYIENRPGAAGTVGAAVAVQAVWAPLVFSKISFLLLPIDAGVVGWLVSQFVPGASWAGTVVYTPSGHDVAITSQCASFHNLSLASLCWVTLSMLHRPYWVKSDLYIGLVAALIQFGFNVWRLVFVCLSLPMYEFWHEGFGKHIFSAIATACAIIFVQISLRVGAPDEAVS